MRRPPQTSQRDDQVHSETDFLALYQEYIPGLKGNSGVNYMGCCPLHGEIPGKSKPSLSVNIENGLWYCFAGCGGGSVKTFLERVGEKRSIIDRKVAALPKTKTKVRAKVSPVVELPEKLLGLYDRCPLALIRDGFKERILFEHDIGYDSELSRITFPIRAHTGKIVGIVGRRRNPEFGKYKVYTRELLKYGFDVQSFSKTDYLWREDKVHPRLSETKTLYVVEGFKAALWFVQSGFDMVVALMGSHMSDVQMRKLESYGKRVILCLDNDVAGKKATLKIADKLSSLSRWVVPLPEGIHQPDDLTEEELEYVCSTPVSISEVKRKWRQISL